MATAPEQLELDENAFAAAFADFGKDQTPPSADTSTAPAAAEAPAPAAATETPAPAEKAPAAAAEAPAEVVEQTDEEKAAAEAAAAEEKPAVTVDDDDEDDKLLKRLARVIKKEPAEAPARAEATPAAAQEMPEILSAEEKTFLAEYEKDWPDVAKAEAIRRKAEYAHLTGYIFNQVMGRFGPMEQMLQQMAEHLQLQQLQTAVPDYEDVREKVVEWVGKQPSYLQNAYQHVIRSGTVDEVNDLIARYKAETGTVTPAAAAAPAPVAAKKEVELPTATKQAAASLAPVGSKRSAVPQQDDPNDFASAFAKFDGLLK